MATYTRYYSFFYGKLKLTLDIIRFFNEKVELTLAIIRFLANSPTHPKYLGPALLHHATWGASVPVVVNLVENENRKNRVKHWYKHGTLF